MLQLKFWLQHNKWLLLMLVIGVVVILWRLLLPGYVLTLDMVFVPQIPSPRLSPGAFWNAALYRLPLHWLSLAVPGWVVQKITFMGVVAALPFNAYCCLSPKTASKYARIWVALFYTVNPFVYTRFLAGQWTILAAYSLLPVVWHVAGRAGAGERKAGLFLGLSLICTTAFSLHIGVIACVVCVFVLLGSMHARSRYAWSALLVAGVVWLVGSVYWIIPAVLRKGESLLEVFDERHLAAFRTAHDPLIGTVGNILALSGFWGEREPWAKQFIWVKDYEVLWLVFGAVLASIILFGLSQTLREKATRRQGIAMACLGIVAVIFSCGVGDTPFSGINNWLFSHLGFWQGFRDSQKWSAALVLVYAFFGGQAFQGRSAQVKTVAASLAVLVFTFPMLFGFWGQLKPVLYPMAWKEGNELIRHTPACKALFLPWHGYFTLKFNHNLLTASPARDFFDCQMVTSRQVELGEIGQQGPIDPAYDAIEGVVTGKDGWNSEQSLEILRSAGIHYIVFARDIENSDPWKYEFLHQPSLKSYTWDGLTIYKLTN